MDKQLAAAETGEVRDAWWGDAPDDANLIAEQERDLQSLEEVEAEIERLAEDRRVFWRHVPGFELLNEGCRLRQILRKEAEGRRLTPEQVETRTLALWKYLERSDREAVELGVQDPNDLLFRSSAKLFRQGAREARSRLAYWQRRRKQAQHLVAHVPQRRESVPAQRPREHRSRSRTRSAARGSPDDSGDLDPEPVAFVPGFTAPSERLSRYLQRRAAARYVR